MELPRLRQAVLVARDLAETCARLEATFDLRRPYADPGVGEFGLANAVYEVGDCFLEVVSPMRDGTTAGRYLDKNGGDGGYMAIFQVADSGAARVRIDELGGRVVWKADLPDISGTHLHPKDTPGAIVSIDEARPPETWHWAGPRWTGGVPDDARAGGLEGITVALRDDEVESARERWTGFVGGLPGVEFVPASASSGVTGIVEIALDVDGMVPASLEVGTARVVAR